MGQSMLLLLWANGAFVLQQKNPKAQTQEMVHRGCFISEYSLERFTGEQPHVSPYIGQRGQGSTTNSAVFQTRWRSLSAKSSMKAGRKMPMTPW